MSINVYFNKLQALQAGGIITAITQIDSDVIGGPTLHYQALWDKLVCMKSAQLKMLHEGL